MILESLEIFNWLRFRGRQGLSLGPGVYSVVARDEADPERSNWLGKTSLVEAIRMALYGAHRHRTEDAWITDGEPEGSVCGDFGGGFCMERSRKRGKSTQLNLTTLDSGDAKGDEAQKIIERAVGMTLRDFEATCYFAQGQVAKLVTTEAGERMKIVDAWLDLGAAARAEEVNAGWLSDCSVDVENLREAVAHRAAVWETELAGQTWDELCEATLKLQAAVTIGRMASESAAVDAALRARLAQREADYAAVVEEGKALAADVGELPDDFEQGARLAQSNLESATRARGAVEAEVRQLRVLARGQFGGECPVAGIACPATDEINASTKKNRERLSTGEADLADRVASAAAAADVARVVRAKVIDLENLGKLRERAKGLKSEMAALKLRIPPGPAPDAAALEAERLATAQKMERALGRMERAAAARDSRAIFAEQLEAAEAKLATLREAAVVLGRNGVRKKIAAPFLEELEAGANDCLAECGVDLRIKVLWEHEGKDPARSCAACGHPFPASAKVKECSRCGLARGRHFVNRLEFELSNKSQAADDLCGIALQLAASAWLRRARGSALSTCVLDEPMAHCDRHNRRALARAFATMLAGRFGFRQAFVVTHTPEAASFGKTILVTGGIDGSRVEVAS